MRRLEEKNEGEYRRLVRHAKSGRLRCRIEERLQHEVRFWGVSKYEEEVLGLFVDTAVGDYIADFGKPPRCLFLMANVVLPGESGSGGGWHLDSMTRQAKAFLYLNDVHESNGPFQYATSVSLGLRIALVVNRLVTGGNRLGAIVVALMRQKHGVVTGKAGTYFYSRTNIPHRGSPVNEGERVAITCYMFDQTPKKYLGYVLNEE